MFRKNPNKTNYSLPKRYFPNKLPREKRPFSWKLGLGIGAVILLLTVIFFNKEIGNLLNLFGTEAKKEGAPKITLSLNPVNQIGGPAGEIPPNNVKEYDINIQIEHGTYFNAGDLSDPCNDDNDPDTEFDGCHLPFLGNINFSVDDLVEQYPEFIESARITVPIEDPDLPGNQINSPWITVLDTIDKNGFFVNRRLTPADKGFITTPPKLIIVLKNYPREHGGFTIDFTIQATADYIPGLGFIYVAPPPGQDISLDAISPVIGHLELEGGVVTNPDFDIAIDPTTRNIHWGESTSYDITVTSKDEFNGEVMLTAPDLTAHMPEDLELVFIFPNPVMVTPTEPGLTSIMVIPLETSTKTVSIDFNAIGTSIDNPLLTHQVAAQLNISPPLTTPDFSISILPPSHDIHWGEPATYDVTLTSLYGFAGNVVLSSPDLVGYIPGYLSDVQFNPPVITLSSGETEHATLTVDSQASPTSTDTLIINFAVFGTYYSPAIPSLVLLEHQTGAQLTISPLQDYSILVQPDSDTVAPGGTAVYTIRLARDNGFAGPVTLTTTLKIPALNPNLQSAVFSDETLELGDPNPTLTVQAKNPNLDATIEFIVFGDTPNLNGVAATRQDGAELRIVNTPDYTIEVTPPNLSVPAGTTAIYTVTIHPENTFSEQVQLQDNVMATYGAYVESVTYDANPITSTTLMHIKTRSGVTHSGFDFTVTGTSSPSNLVRTGQANLAISTAPNYSLSIYPLTRTVAPGGSANYTVTLTRIGGFSGSVSLSTDLGTKAGVASVVFNPPTLSGAILSATMTATATNPANSADHLFVVDGYNIALGGRSTEQAHFIIANTADFTISIAPPKSQTVNPGNSATYQIILTRLNGYRETVTLTHNLVNQFVESAVFDDATLEYGGDDVALLVVTATNPANNSTLPFIVTGTGLVNGVSANRTDNGEFVIVNLQDYIISINPDSRTVAPGGITTYTVTLERKFGFTGTVVLTTDLGSKAGVQSAILNPSALVGSTLTSTLTVTAANPAGNTTHVFNVFGDTSNLNGVPAQRSDSATFIIRNTPDFNIQVDPASITVTPGGTAVYDVTLILINNYANTVTLTNNLLSNYGAYIQSATFDITALSPTNLTTKLRVTTKTGINNQDIIGFIVTGTGLVEGVSAQRTDTANLLIRNLFDYNINIDPASRTVAPGGVTTYTITLTRDFGFAGDVVLTTDLGSKAGVQSAVINPGTLSGSILTATLTVTAMNPTLDYTHIFNVFGNTSNLNGAPAQRSDTAIFIIQNNEDFTVAITPDIRQIAPGGNTSYSVTVTRINNFTGTINLTTDLGSKSGIQSAVFADNQLSNGETTTTLAVTTTLSISAADILFVVFGNGTPEGVPTTRQDTATLSIVDFRIDIDPNSRTVLPGDSTTYAVNLTRLNNFSGTVSLTTDLNTKPHIDRIEFSDTNLTSGENSTILTVYTTGPASDMTISFIVTGNSTVDSVPLSHQDTAVLILFTPLTQDFTITITPDTRSIDVGDSTTYDVLLHRLNGFNKAVALTTGLLNDNPDYITQVIFDIDVFPASAADQTTVLHVTSKDTLTGSITLPFMVTGTETITGLPEHSDTATLQINYTSPPPPPPTPDFTIRISPDLREVDAGESTDYTVTVTPTNNFTDRVILTHNLLSDFADYISDVTFDALQLDQDNDWTTVMHVVTKSISNSQLFTFTVTGTAISGSPVHSDDADLQINVAGSTITPPPGGGGGGGTYTPPTPATPPAPTTGGAEDFTVQVTPITNTTIYPGQSATYQVTIIRLGGFTGPVTLSTDILQLNYDVASATFGQTTIPTGETTTTLLLVARPNAVIDSSTLFNVQGTSTTLGERKDDAPVAIIIPRGLPATGPNDTSHWFWIAIFVLAWLSWQQLQTLPSRRRSK